MPATNKKKRRILTPEQSRRRSKITRRVRPWEKSSGPKSIEGKRRVAQNARKHGERDAKNRASGRLITTANRAIKVLGLLNHASLGLPLRPSHYLKGVSIGDWYRTAARVKHIAENWPKDSDDTRVWTEWLDKHRRLGEGLPFDLPEDVADVRLVDAAAELKAELYAQPLSLLA